MRGGGTGDIPESQRVGGVDKVGFLLTASTCVVQGTPNTGLGKRDETDNDDVEQRTAIPSREPRNRFRLLALGLDHGPIVDNFLLLLGGGHLDRDSI